MTQTKWMRRQKTLKRKFMEVLLLKCNHNRSNRHLLKHRVRLSNLNKCNSESQTFFQTEVSSKSHSNRLWDQDLTRVLRWAQDHNYQTCRTLTLEYKWMRVANPMVEAWWTRIFRIECNKTTVSPKASSNLQNKEKASVDPQWALTTFPIRPEHLELSKKIKGSNKSRTL